MTDFPRGEFTFKRQTDLFALAQSAGMPVWELDLETSKGRYSAEYSRLIGLPAREQSLEVLEVLGCIHPEDRERVATAVNLSTPRSERYDQMFRTVWKDGSLHWLHTRGFIFRDETMGRDRFLGFSVDLTEHRRTEQLLRNAEERLRLAQQAGGVGTWDWNLETQAIVWTEQCARLHGAPPEKTNLTVQEFAAFISFEDSARVQEELRGVIAGGGGRDLEFRVLHSGSNVRWLLAKAGLAYGPDGRPSTLHGAAIDITERKKADEALRGLNDILEQRIAERTAELAAANRELEAFAYSVSHDLRAPLRAMNGFSRILLEDFAENLCGEAQGYLGRICENAKRMGQLIDDLLSFSRLGRHEIRRQTVSTASLVGEVLDDFRAEIEQRHVRIVVAELPSCTAELALLRQVYANLASNALKFTRQCAHAVIEFGFEREDSGAAVYFVRDNGAGFDPRYAHKLFGVFQRLHGLDEYEGTGVGLAIVQRIIQRHGGRVWAESQPNYGASFYFTLGETSA